MWVDACKSERRIEDLRDGGTPIKIDVENERRRRKRVREEHMERGDGECECLLFHGKRKIVIVQREGNS